MTRLFCRIFAMTAAVLLSICAHAQTPPPVQSRVVILRPHGFEPAQINVRAGQLRLMVRNINPRRALNLRLDRDGGPRLRESTMPRGKLAWRETLDLAPGLYLLTEPGRPYWICRIVVSP